MGSIETKRESNVLGGRSDITQVTKQPIHVGGILLCFRLYNNITITIAIALVIQIDAEIFTLYKLYHPYRMV